MSFRALLVSDFNIENLAGLLNNADGEPSIEASVAPFGQVMPILLDRAHAVWSEPQDAAIVWTRLQDVSPAFGAALAGGAPDADALFEEVDRFAELLIGLEERVASVFVPDWVLPGYQRGRGLLDLRPGGHRRLLLEANLRLVRALDAHPQIFCFSTQRWVERAGAAAHNPKFWYMGKIAFGAQVFQHATVDIRAAVAGLRGQSRKLVVVDLDDTLWGGIVGDEGMERLKLGGHDPLGEAFVEFQNALRALRARGVLLAIASKNEESVAMEAIEKHPEMRLRIDDFVAWRIDWNDKAQNIQDMVQELNLGLQSVVFLDDSPAERARVAEALPEVLVPDWPRDKMLYAKALEELTCFDVSAVSAEDRARTEMYAWERQRNATRTQIGSVDEWLESLQLDVLVEVPGADNIKRTAQLLNKTNQMNLSTRRLTEPELLGWLETEGRCLWSLRVKDRFGDSGLTGIVSVDCNGEEAVLVDFVLSCRVFGRQLERLMVSVAVDWAREQGKNALVARYLKTAKNKPTRDFLEGSGLTKSGDDCYRWDLGQRYPAPDFISVRLKEA